MSKFPKGSVRAAVAAVGDVWTLVHEPNHQGERNNSLAAELRDQLVMAWCHYLSSRYGRASMLRRATFGMNKREPGS